MTDNPAWEEKDEEEHMVRRDRENDHLITRIK